MRPGSTWPPSRTPSMPLAERPATRGRAAGRRADLGGDGGMARTAQFVEDAGAHRGARPADEPARATPRHARPSSVLGALLDRDGPESLGDHLARLADAALVDSRVLLAHRLGADESTWPPAEDRFASDLLLPDRIADPWLRRYGVGFGGADPDPARRPHAGRTRRPARGRACRRRTAPDRWN